MNRADNEGSPRASLQDLKAASFHEAGHAVIAIVLGATIEKAIINPDGSGQTDYVAEGPVSLRTAAGRRRAIRWLLVCHSGPESEIQFAGEIDQSACATDFMMAEARSRRRRRC
jgi:hypothetical protein